VQALLDRLPRTLSGGERQRVALGRSLVREPSALLLDEPLSNLDARLRHQMRGEIKRLRRDVRTTVFYVTHDQEEAMTLGDRVSVMQGGTLQQCGTPEEVYEEPANRFVAGFVGMPPMNFLAGRIVRTDREFAFWEGVNRLLLSAPQQRGLAGHVDQPINASVVQFRAEVVDVERVGDRAEVALSIMGQSDLIRRTTGRTVVRIGECVQVGVDMSRAHFFETTGQERRLTWAAEHGTA
jgi:ABC-type sugar transport system ATPase subunit